MAPTDLPYKRILLKLSGEALMGRFDYGFDPENVNRIAYDIKKVLDDGIELCLVIGGGNIFRGNLGAAQGIDRPTSDAMGMLATVMNSLAVQSALENIGVATCVMSSIEIHAICEPYNRRKALRHLEKGRVVIFAAGTGNPYFTTDTAGVLRACEMNCDVLAKGTKVNGVYSADPIKNQNAKHHPYLSYERVLRDNLNVMDTTAVTLALENKMPLIIFSIKEAGNFAKVLRKEGIFSYIHSEN
ncbi:MAG: UMP kinase [Alphaproteobacteria bacterium]|nr:UMP kinase [Alphaproteobacteria bacterium]